MKMLLVEDNAKHIVDAQKFVESVRETFDLEVRYATTLEEALALLDWAEVVASDIFFPREQDGSPVPVMPYLQGHEEILAFAPQISGVALAEKALAAGKKVVFCTSTYHHGDKTAPASLWARKYEIQMVDANLDADRNGEAATKSWEAAVLYAVYLHRGGHVETINEYGCPSRPPLASNVAYAISRREMVKDSGFDEILRIYYALLAG
ncbi:MAG: hypothetical protein PHC70_00790 [Patescibacteria group bacterium]|nr:hypothetical protein [Patescibacteria group bacterium]